jgi:hypothetical protein
MSKLANVSIASEDPHRCSDLYQGNTTKANNNVLFASIYIKYLPRNAQLVMGHINYKYHTILIGFFGVTFFINWISVYLLKHVTGRMMIEVQQITDISTWLAMILRASLATVLM